MHHVVAVHTYLAKAMTTFMESDSKTNDEKGTHAIIMSGKVTFSQRSLNFGKGSKVTLLCIYLPSLTTTLETLTTLTVPTTMTTLTTVTTLTILTVIDERPKRMILTTQTKKSVQYCDVRAVLHSCNVFSMKRP